MEKNKPVKYKDLLNNAYLFQYGMMVLKMRFRRYSLESRIFSTSKSPRKRLPRRMPSSWCKQRGSPLPLLPTRPTAIPTSSASKVPHPLPPTRVRRRRTRRSAFLMTLRPQKKRLSSLATRSTSSSLHHPKPKIRPLFSTFLIFASLASQCRKIWLEVDKIVALRETAKKAWAKANKAQKDALRAQKDVEALLEAEKKRLEAQKSLSAELEHKKVVTEKEATDFKVSADNTFSIMAEIKKVGEAIRANKTKQLFNELKSDYYVLVVLVKESHDELRTMKATNEALVLANKTVKSEKDSLQTKMETLRLKEIG
ncbi:hypothetical protein NE237_028503 [Protea cynaroides]|uniref:Uncharacterized protein n=1 Tax=Protea cynaroides TaxID=273540 RepID=A0A9Q0GRA6_9MAGN|nr:hypothetical protein NE237_028503 [Protea cynaroides]